MTPASGGTIVIHTSTLQRFADLILELHDRLYPLTDTDEGGRFPRRREDELRARRTRRTDGSLLSVSRERDMETKPFWQSLTFWVNFGGAVIAGASWILQNQGLLTLFGASPEIVAVIVAIANIILRFRTTSPVALTTERAQVDNRSRGL